MNVETVTPYRDAVSKREQIQTLFNTIAPRYDRLNTVLSWGLDRAWRGALTRAVQACAPHRFLDVATGTGAVATALKQACPSAEITGVDVSEGMLAVARQRNTCVTWKVGDALALPFASESFDGVSVAFGLRNFEHLEEGLRELHRVLSSGGRVFVLDFSLPEHRVWRVLCEAYLRFVLAIVPRIVGGHVREYAYLHRSIAAMPSAKTICALLQKVGFTEPRAQPLFPPIAWLITANR